MLYLCLHPDIYTLHGEGDVQYLLIMGREEGKKGEKKTGIVYE